MVAGSAADPLPADAERSSAPPKTDAPTSAFASGAVAEVAALASKLLDADEGTAASAMADVLERIKELASENEILRASLAEEHETHLNALEANRELNWRVRTGSSAGADATTVTREWEASDAKMALLMGENNELEARWRQTAEELEKERAGTAQLMASHTEALAAARQAASAADAADAAANEEAQASREAADVAREAQALAAASDVALANLRNELAAAREDGAAAHRESASLRVEVERLHGAAAQRAADEGERMAEAKRQLIETERQLSATRVELQRTEAALGEARGVADGHMAAADRMRQAAERAQDEAAAQAEAARESARSTVRIQAREKESDDQIATLSRKLESQSETLERQSVSAQRAAAEAALKHAQALAEAREGTRNETRLASEREAALQTVIDSLTASREKDARERAGLQSALDAAVTAASMAKAQMGEAARGGDVALREEVMSAKARAEESDIEVRQLRSELKSARDEATRERATAVGKVSELERAEIRARRAVSQAESERDLMAAKLAQRGEAADATIADAYAISERSRAEVVAARQRAASEVEDARAHEAAFQTQLTDAVAAAAGLQELLEAQQQVAEAYRREASRSLARLAQLEQAQHEPLQQTLQTYREEGAREREAITNELKQQQLAVQQAISSSLEMQRSSSLEDVHKGIDELRAELRGARETQEQQRMALESARLVVQ